MAESEPSRNLRLSSLRHHLEYRLSLWRRSWEGGHSCPPRTYARSAPIIRVGTRDGRTRAGFSGGSARFARVFTWRTGMSPLPARLSVDRTAFLDPGG